MLVHAWLLALCSIHKTQSEATKASDFKSSTKTYLMVIALYYVLWVFLNSDGSECTEVILNEEEFTPLAVAHWNYWSVGTFDKALIFIWAILSKDLVAQIATCKAVALMQIPSLIVVWYLLPITTLDIQMKTTISFTLMFLFAIRAVKKDIATSNAKTE